MVSHFDYKHRCLVEKNVPTALILPSRCWYGAESLGWSALAVYDTYLEHFQTKNTLHNFSKFVIALDRRLVIPESMEVIYYQRMLEHICLIGFKLFCVKNKFGKLRCVIASKRSILFGPRLNNAPSLRLHHPVTYLL